MVFDSTLRGIRLQIDQIADPGERPEVQFRLIDNPTDTWMLGRVRGIEQVGFGGQLTFETNPGSATPGDLTTERMRIDKNGNVGIGTVSPGFRLDVNGALNATDILRNGTSIVGSQWSNVTGGISFNAGNVGINTSSPTHKLHVSDNSGIRQNQLYLSGSTQWSSLSYNAHHNPANNAWVFPDPGRVAVTVEMDDSGGRGRFEVWGTTTAAKTAWVQRLHVDGESGDTFLAHNGGRVGIGFTQPRTQLHVLGRIASGADFTSAGAITFFPPDGFAWFHIDNGPAGGRPLGRMRFSYGGSPGDHEVMCILQNNTVGIGTTTPRATLEVNGHIVLGTDLKLVGRGGGAGNNGGLGRGLVDGGRDLGLAVNWANDFGRITMTGPVFANVVGPSDARLKENVAPLTDALDKLRRIRGVSFDWRDQEEMLSGPAGTRSVGVIAQDVEAVFPELVATWGRAGYRAVDYSRLVAVVVEAIKELDAKVERLGKATENP